MKSSCIEANIFAGYTEGSLSEEEREYLLNHIAKCDECREEFIMLNLLANDPELSDLRRASLDKTGAIRKIPRRILSGIRNKIKKKKAESFYKWIPNPEDMTQPALSGLRSHSVGSTETAHVPFKTGGIKMDLYLEKAGPASFDFYLIMSEAKKNGKNIRLTCKKENKTIASRLLSKKEEVLQDMAFGSYELIFTKHGDTIGICSVKIGSDGIRIL